MKQHITKSPFKLIARIEDDIDKLGYSRDYYNLLVREGFKTKAEKYKVIKE
jgi:hypothetical protein